MAERPEEAPNAATHEPTAGGGRAGRAGPPTWVAMSGLGFEFVAAILLPGAIGWWLDRQVGSTPWIMLAGGLLGFVVGLRLLMKSVNRPSKKS